ncbi:hypothetical protein LTR78_004605 [Recurvomyces mirabilis]|uniref:GRF-type domain-containing protein n=1 Tax=Recurvomyces mirabilis TaxID=574656 RepID=A0AAE0WPL8_9PEZI|nr:hypothetical protein LTR78_004605 [Recurvomyces mirabilis]KAK5152900.1 hypothetical protein LTS14_008008 [Recurvomyces mirabilis]
MYRGGGGRYRGGRGGARGSKSTTTTTTTTTQKGLFAEGIWQCNCTPRLPAEHFKVKKEGKNQGRWFYTCQNSEPKRCGFFLWDEDAKPREEAAVLSGRRTEPGASTGGGGRMSLGGSCEVQEGWDAGRAARAARTDAMGGRGVGGGSGRGLFAQQGIGRGSARRVEDEETQSPSPRRISPPPPYTAMPSSSNTKRKAPQAGIDEEDDDEFFPWPLTGQEERALAQAADHTTAPQTPHKAVKTGVYATPATSVGRKLPWLEQQQTPRTPSTTPNTAGYFDTPTKSTSTLAAPSVVQNTTPLHQNPIILPAAKTPSPPARHKDALLNPADSESISKGRDIARLAVKAKEAKIAELEAKIVGLENAKIAELRTRIASLEAEREVQRVVVGELRWRVANPNSGGEMDSQETII